MVDIATMPVIQSGKAKAPTKGGSKGFALGTIIVREAIDKANAEAKHNETMKQTLKRIKAFTREDHLSFRAVLQDKLDEQSAVAKALGTNLTAYRAGDSVVNSIVVTVSLWRKMSTACEVGFTPDYACPWSELSCQATEAVNSVASAGDQAVTKGTPTARKGRKSTSQLKKTMDAATLLIEEPVKFLEFAKWVNDQVAKMKAVK
jgi:hypothetical protein